MNLNYALICVAVMALVTYLPRVLPISIFQKEIKSPFAKSFLDYTPYAVLGALTFPDIFTSTGVLISAIAGTVVAFILSYFERGLVVVALGAIFTAYLVQCFI